MSEQLLLLVDEKDRFTGSYAPRQNCHKSPGLHHRAFTCLLFNSKGEVLLQKRKHPLWGNLWDLTACSHPLHLNGRDESYEEATLRALKNEMGIDKTQLKNVGGFNYFAKYKNNLCENEYCAILISKYDGQVNPNPEVVYQYRWIKFDNFRNEIEKNPKNFVPWARLAVKELKSIDFGQVVNF